jgi:hypothetical protein
MTWNVAVRAASKQFNVMKPSADFHYVLFHPSQAIVDAVPMRVKK